MPYSLVSAATLGFDLVRIPAGRFVADVLLTGLAADGDQLSRLAAAHPAHGLDRAGRGALAVRSRRARELAAAVPQVRSVRRGTPDAGADRTALLLAQLETGTIGDARTVERLLRDDVLGPEHSSAASLDPAERAQATDVLADAAVGWWSAGVLPPLVRRELTEPFERAALPAVLPGALDLGPASADVRVLLDDLAHLDGRGRTAWRTVVDAGRGDHRSWATAMHEASWAAHVSGRTRSLAGAQLLAVRAFRDGGLDGPDGAHGVWNAVSGCVQGLAMADLLDERSLTALTAPLRRLSA